MFTKTNICSLKTQAEFDDVNNGGQKLSSHYFLLIGKCHGCNLDQQNIIKFQKSSIKFGMKVSRKLSKLAVIRNKMKRRIRHLVRLAAVALPTPHNFSIIIIPRRGFDSLDFAILKQDFDQKIRRLIKNQMA